MIAAMVTVQALGLLAWLLASRRWWADVVAQVPLFWMGWGVLGVGVAVAADRRWVAPIAVAAVLQGARVGTLWLGPAPEASGTELGVLVANVQASNDRFELLLELVAAEDPDVVGLLEIDDRWLTALEPLRERYPYRVEVPRTDAFGLALYSRVPLEDVRRVDLSGVGVPTVVLTGPGEVQVILTHPLPPISVEYAGSRDAQLRRLAELLDDADGNALLLGDLNATPWSHAFPAQIPRHLPVGTWPASLPLRLPIDHVIPGARLALTSWRVGPDIGSDHLPVIARVRLPGP